MRATWLLGLLLLLPTAGAGSEVRLLLPEGPTLRPGQTVEVSWQGVPESARECELLLELTAGRPSARVGARFEHGEASFAWRVPNLPATRARLVLRAGIRHEEVEVGWSEPFEIVASPFALPAVVSRHEGELWVGRPDTGEPPLGPGSLDSPGIGAPLDERLPLEVPPDSASAVASAGGGDVPAPGFAPLGLTDASGHPLLKRPRIVPMRN